MESNKLVNYISLPVSMKLKEIGFNRKCGAKYVKYLTICNSIMEKHPGLSDDGYNDLLKTNGGMYEFDEVYKNENKLLFSDDILFTEYEYGDDNFICYCPTVLEVLDWFVEQYNCHISVQFEADEIGMLPLVQVLIYDKDDEEYLSRFSSGLYECIDCKNNYNDILTFGIEIAIDKIIEMKELKQLNNNDMEHNKPKTNNSENVVPNTVSFSSISYSRNIENIVSDYDLVSTPTVNIETNNISNEEINNKEEERYNPWNECCKEVGGLKGWICPKCGRVFSPFTNICLHCNGNSNIVYSTKYTF